MPKLPTVKPKELLKICKKLVLQLIMLVVATIFYTTRLAKDEQLFPCIIENFRPEH